MLADSGVVETNTRKPLSTIIKALATMEETQHLFLCVNCRKAGHLASECTEKWTRDSLRWFFSTKRRILHGLLPAAARTCDRCKDLDIIRMLREDIPWRTPQDLIRAQKEGHPSIRKLGQAGTVEFLSSCPVCVCLFALTPSPAAATDEIFVFADWTLNRLAGENGTDMDREEKRQYAKCLLVAIEPDPTIISFYIRAHRGDALCIAEEHLSSNETLGGCKVETTSFNLNRCKSWLESCRRLHGTDCDPEYTNELQGIRLLDLDSREIVAYPGSPCDYATLSYVWGGVEQRSYQVGSRLGILPRTIEDAMECAKLLGKRYLWVDSLCIDQGDDPDKTDQIARMWSIYRGSSITLITLSSPSADSGLSRFSPGLEAQPQLECTIDGIRLVGLMPTLSQYIWTESWGSRAWTLQEALLSHRCLYLSDHQLYFECETMQYCESLDEQRSWGHKLTALTSPDRQHWLTWVMEQNGSGCLRNLLDTPADRFLHWGQKLTLYSYRAMTNQEDGLRAFHGVLQRLETMYTAGFFWGIPLEDFQWGLLWQARWTPRRRAGFPSWCWAGWQAGMLTPFPADVKYPHCSPVALKIWKAKKLKLELLFDAQQRASRAPKWSSDDQEETANDDEQSTEAEANQDPESGDGEDESNPTEITPSIEEIFGLSRYTDAEDWALFIETFTIDLQPDFSKPRHEQALGGQRGHFDIQLSDLQCSIYAMTTDIFIDIYKDDTLSFRYLVLALNSWQTVLEVHILVVLDHGQFCTRVTSMSLVIPSNNFQNILRGLGLKREYVVLA